MARSLKEQNNFGLYALMAANLVAFFGVLSGQFVLTENWQDLAHSAYQLLPASVGVLLTALINAQLSADAKARIVFLRWKNPLPGCEAFTRYARLDPRIDLQVLRQTYGSLPTGPKKQNSLWYQIYKSVESDPAVIHAHKGYLFTRDYACIALMLLIVFGGIALYQLVPKWPAWIYISGLLLQFLLAGQAARTHGRRFVTSVLAVKSAGR